MNKKKTKKVHRHLKIKPFLTLLFIIAIFVTSVLYISNVKIKNIYINGITYLSDYDVISTANIKDYPKLIKYSSHTIAKKIKKLALVEDVKVKKNIFGKVTISIEEASPLFYNRNTSTYVLSNKKTTTDYSFLGVPFLINYVPDDIYERLITELASVDKEALAMVSEIEYSPSKSGDVVIDDTRFLLRMNDGNQVYINLINIDRLNTYPLIYTVFTEKGVLELDSDNDNVVFKSYQSIAENNS
jgi:cell division septal protein FtsQ